MATDPSTVAFASHISKASLGDFCGDATLGQPKCSRKLPDAFDAAQTATSRTVRPTGAGSGDVRHTVWHTAGSIKCGMTHDWLLVETLGDEPAVVAQGSQLKNLVPLTAFLRRNPRLAAIRTAIAESVQTGQSLASITPKKDRVIRTEPVLMPDGRVHGVHVWSGPAHADPPQRPMPGACKWDLTVGAATDTRESLINNGKNPDVENTRGRVFAENWPPRVLKPNEGKVLARVVKPEPGQTLCIAWDASDWHGNPITVGFVARHCLEWGQDGLDHLVARGMNWRVDRDDAAEPDECLAQKVLNGLAQPGVHRALFDLNTWLLLKWLDEPCPFYDWRNATGSSRVHPDDEPLMRSMTTEFAHGATARVLRLPAAGGSWVPVHVTVSRVEVEEQTFAGLISLRLPTDQELADAGLPPVT